jgi:hypothetical protein
VPNDKFPVLHQSVVGRIEYLETSYWSFYKQFLKNLRANNLHKAWHEKKQPSGNAKATGVSA